MGKGNSAANVNATRRLQQDYLRLKRDPLPYVVAEPLQENILEWHYVVRGPEDSPYAGGFYHGRLVFPREFPFKPPSIYMITPNGRFHCNTRLCLSISDFHPDTWNPAWTVSSILTGLLSFMLETSPTLGSVETSADTKRELAQRSLEFNLKNSTFVSLFAELTEEIRQELSRRNMELTLSGAPRVRAASDTISEEQEQLISLRRLLNNGTTALNNNTNVAEGLATNRRWFCVQNIILMALIFLFGMLVRYVLLSVNE
jgi:ubiquitin-conjugating enzyme E2 J2